MHELSIKVAWLELRGAPRLLRPGSITRAQLEAVLGIAVPDAGVDAPRASGRLESHYAPRTPLECVEAAQLPARLNALRGQRLAVLAPAAALLDPGPQVVLRLVAPDSAEAYAQQLYALLHRLDAAGAERILRREVDAKAHSELLAGLKKEL